MPSSTRFTAVAAYNPLQRGLHWAMAAFIFIALALGMVAVQLPRGGLRSDVLFVHKSFGVTIFVLAILRVGLRIVAGAPAYRKPLDRLSELGSKAAHLALYALMLVLPVSGYVISSAGGNVVPFFGLFALPNVVTHDRELAEKAAGAHLVFAWAIGIVLALHIAAALWHAWVKRDEVMARMWPGFGGRLV
jgi:cytochrome b561